MNYITALMKMIASEEHSNTQQWSIVSSWKETRRRERHMTKVSLKGREGWSSFPFCLVGWSMSFFLSRMAHQGIKDKASFALSCIQCWCLCTRWDYSEENVRPCFYLLRARLFLLFYVLQFICSLHLRIMSYHPQCLQCIMTFLRPSMNGDGDLLSISPSK